VAQEFIDKAAREGRAEATLAKLRWMREWLLPAVGHRPVDQVEPHELLAVMKRLEKAGQLETARRVRSFASRVFRYAVATGPREERPRRAAARRHRGALGRRTSPPSWSPGGWASFCAPSRATRGSR
jgi:hypothetical protein